MKPLKPYRFSLLLALCALFCGVLYTAIGAYVDESGVLREPFALIPLFWLSAFLAICSFIFAWLKRLDKR